MPLRPPSLDALDAVVSLSRLVADADDPSAIPALLADTAARCLSNVELVAVLTTTDDGPQLAEVRGIEPEHLDTPEGIDSEMGRSLVSRLPGIGQVRSYLVTSGGDLFGGLVVAWAAGTAGDPAADRLASALADIAATGLDRTLRTQELRRTIDALVASREELARTESLRSLGQMAAVVAHEVKNPLTSIGGVLQVLRGRFPAPSTEHDIIGKVLDRLAELNRMVDELLSFARPRPPNRAPVSCGAFLSGVVGLFEQDPGSANVQVRLVAEDLHVDVDLGMFQRVLHNLLINASQAMGGAGTIELRCRPDGAFAELTVSDEGPGIPEENRSRVFEPFFTTKVRGSGLGLAIARQVLESHGGTLSYRPAPGGGACFVLRVPRLRDGGAP